MANILIVDDSQLSRRMLRSFLEPAGHTVREADEGLSALEAYAAQRPDLVFLDMTMKGMHGLEVLSQLRRLDREARVVVATADIQESTQQMSAEGGATAFLQKPFTRAKVQDALSQALDSENA